MLQQGLCLELLDVGIRDGAKKIGRQRMGLARIDNPGHGNKIKLTNNRLIIAINQSLIILINPLGMQTAKVYRGWWGQTLRKALS